MTLTCGQCSRDIDNPHYSLNLAVADGKRVAVSRTGIVVCYTDFSRLSSNLKPLVFTSDISYRVGEERRANGFNVVPDTDSRILTKDFLGYIDPSVVEKSIPRVASSLKGYVEREPRLPEDAPKMLRTMLRRLERGDVEGAERIYRAALAQSLNPATPTKQALNALRVVSIVDDLREARWLDISGEGFVPARWADEFYKQRKPA